MSRSSSPSQAVASCSLPPVIAIFLCLSVAQPERTSAPLGVCAMAAIRADRLLAADGAVPASSVAPPEGLLHPPTAQSFETPPGPHRHRDQPLDSREGVKPVLRCRLRTSGCG